MKTNIGAITKAIDALKKDMGAALLQTQAATTLKNFVDNDQKMLNVDREDLTAFLSDGIQSGAAGAIVGILEQMRDTMNANLADATGTEEESIKAFNALVAAKTKEIEALTASIDDKTSAIGEVGVQIVQMKEDLSYAEEKLEDMGKMGLGKMKSLVATFVCARSCPCAFGRRHNFRFFRCLMKIVSHCIRVR